MIVMLSVCMHGPILHLFLPSPPLPSPSPPPPTYTLSPFPTPFSSSPYSVVGVEGQTGASPLSVPMQAALPPQSPYLSYNSFTIPQSPTYLQPSQFQQGTAGGGSSQFMQMAAASPSPLYPLYPVQQQQ